MRHSICRATALCSFIPAAIAGNAAITPTVYVGIYPELAEDTTCLNLTGGGQRETVMLTGDCSEAIFLSDGAIVTIPLGATAPGTRVAVWCSRMPLHRPRS